MRFRLALVSGLLWLLTRAFADVPVYFDNRAFGTAGLVTLQYPFGVDKGGLQNGIPETDSAWIAQLYRVVSTNGAVVRIPVGIPANFRALWTSMPGTWSGGTRTIPGVSPGEVVRLQVRVWDKNHNVSFEAARSCGYLAGESRIFDYTYSPSIPEQPTDKEMKNFLGFVVTQPLSPCYLGNPSPPPPHLVPVTENEDTAIVPPRDFTYGESIWMMRVIEGSQTNRLSGSALGQVAIKGDDWVYRPNPFSYGIEEIWGGFCCGNNIVYARFEIAPSPRRPYLDVTTPNASSPRSLVLRGLAPKRYRVEQSSDLGAWTPVGEFTANTSEVPVRELTDDGPEARFFRAVEVLP